MIEERPNSKSPTHICIPVLSIMKLLVLTLTVETNTTVLHYDVLPRSLRGISRLLKISHERIMIVLSAITGFSIQKIKHGDDVPDYPNLHLNVMETVTKISNQLIPAVKESSWMKLFNKLLGEKPSLAYIAKYLSEYQLFKHILPMTACYKSIHSPENYIVMWNPEWPTEWNPVISRNLQWIKFEFFKWPAWYTSIRGFINKIVLLLGLLAIPLVYIIRRGITLGSVSKKHFKIINEFNDPKRLGGTVYDADYWIDGNNVTKDDVLFFLTNMQKKIIIKNGHTIKDIVKLFQNKGYELTILDDLSYSLPAIGYLVSLYLKCFKYIFRFDVPAFSRLFLKVWSEYMEFLPLFLHYSSKNLIYITFANGNVRLRFDDAIITSLCRKYGIRSVGCQTRAIYSNNFEYCFDCFDIYLSWGTSWEQISKDRMLFIDKVVTVGCIYLDYLFPLYKGYLKNKVYYEQKKDVTVSIFNSDISNDHHYTKGYTKSLLLSCIKLAREFPTCTFKVKTKDPGHINIMMGDKEFYDAYSDVLDRFFFIDNVRYDYAEILCSSDIVIAMGFTTPGVEGLLLGKRSIYYSELGCGGQPYKHIPSFVATNTEELMNLFAEAVNNYVNYSGINSDYISKLDPFRDGQALERIQRVLLEN